MTERLTVNTPGHIDRQTLHGQERREKEAELEAMTDDQLESYIQERAWVFDLRAGKVPSDDGSEEWRERVGRVVAEGALAKNILYAREEEALRKRRESKDQNKT